MNDRGDPLADAEEAVRTSVADPRRAQDRARAALERADREGHDEAASVALRALALAARELGDLPLAETHLREAVRRGGAVPRRAAQARMSLVSVRTELGDPVGALRLADQAEPGLTGADLAALCVQRAITLARLGRHHEAVRQCDRALAAPGTPRDPRLLAAALLNRGLAHTYLEDHRAGAGDLAECRRVAQAAGLDHVVALAEANLSFNAARRGDIPAAFSAYEAAERLLSGCPERLAALRADFAEALIAARLPGEARALLDLAVPELAAAGALVHLAEARLLLARVELLSGDPHRALELAHAARDELRGQGRADWAPLADEVAVRARRALEAASPALLADTLACADALETGGRAAVAAPLRLFASGLALDLGDDVTVRAQLDLVIARGGRTVVRRHAVAMRERLAGDHARALAAARAGLAALGRVGGPAHVRAHVARTAEDLAAFGLGLALETGRPATVLAWAERWRATVRSEPPLTSFTVAALRAALGDAVLIELVRHDDDLAAVTVTRDGLALLRLGSYRSAAEATVRLRYALRRIGLRDLGAPDGPRLDLRPDPRTHAATDTRTEATADPHAGARPPTQCQDTTPTPRPADTDTCDQADTQAEACADDVDVHGGPCRPNGLRTGSPAGGGADGGGRCGSGDDVSEAVSRADGPGVAGARAAVEREGDLVARLVLGPLADAPDGRPLVIVPTGALHTLPWGALPPLRGRPVCVAPSAAAWLAAASGEPHAMAWRPPLQAPGNGTSGTQESRPVRPPELRPTGMPEDQPTRSSQYSASRTPQSRPAGSPPSRPTRTSDYGPTSISDDGPVGPSRSRPGRAPEDRHAEPHQDGPTRMPGDRRGDRFVGGVFRVAVVAGPDLEHAVAEADVVAGIHRYSVRVAARRAEVLAALGCADLVHIAAHGVFCARSPLLSRIALEDGPLMAYDLLRLARTPRLVVLSACDGGMAHAPADGAPLGLAGTFLDRGSGCVVASVVPVRDEDTLALMARFHRRLVCGDAPSTALAAAGGGVTGFVCLGAGWGRAGAVPCGARWAVQPVATGRAGSVTQLDQEPT